LVLNWFIPENDSRPGLPGKIEVLGRKAQKYFTGKINFKESHFAKGVAVSLCIQAGQDWTKLGNISALKNRGDELRLFAEASVIAASTGLPVEWLVKGTESVEGLRMIKKAVELARKVNRNHMFWSSVMTPSQVIDQEMNVLLALEDALVASLKTNPKSDDEKEDLKQSTTTVDLRDMDMEAFIEGLLPVPSELPKLPSESDIKVKAKTCTDNNCVIVKRIELHEPGALVVINNELRYVCCGKHGKCRALMTPEVARVTADESRLRRQYRIPAWKQIVTEDFQSDRHTVYCPSCSKFILKDGSKTLAQWITSAEETERDLSRNGRQIARNLGYNNPLNNDAYLELALAEPGLRANGIVGPNQTRKGPMGIRAALAISKTNPNRRNGKNRSNNRNAQRS
jgi:hypothetical protein